MGLFKRRGRTDTAMYLVDSTASDYRFDIVGESRCRDHLSACIRQADVALREAGEIETVAELVPEPSNQFDPNAVQVWINGGRVGYISKAENLLILEAFLKARSRGATRLLVLARIGWDSSSSDPLIGVRLRLTGDSDQWRAMTRDEIAAEADAE